MTTPTPDTGLATALAASLSPDAELDLDACLRRKAELLGDARSLTELTEAELIEFHTLCTRIRGLSQTAGKPAARSKKTVTSVDSVADDLA